MSSIFLKVGCMTLNHSRSKRFNVIGRKMGRGWKKNTVETIM
jgi:hypothetical protein